MKYYLTWGDSEYSSYEEVFDTKEEVLAFLKKVGGNPSAHFRLIRGTEIELRPVEIVKSFDFDE